MLTTQEANDWLARLRKNVETKFINEGKTLDSYLVLSIQNYIDLEFIELRQQAETLFWAEGLQLVGCKCFSEKNTVRVIWRTDFYPRSRYNSYIGIESVALGFHEQYDLYWLPYIQRIEAYFGKSYSDKIYYDIIGKSVGSLYNLEEPFRTAYNRLKTLNYKTAVEHNRSFRPVRVL